MIDYIKLAHKYKIIENDDIWFDFVNCRNRLSHIYSEPDSHDTFQFIESNWSELEKFAKILESKI